MACAEYAEAIVSADGRRIEAVAAGLPSWALALGGRGRERSAAAHRTAGRAEAHAPPLARCCCSSSAKAHGHRLSRSPVGGGAYAEGA